MPQFRVTIEGLHLDEVRAAVERAGIQPHGPGWGQREGEAPEMVPAQVVFEMEAESAGDAEARVSKALPGDGYTVRAQAM